MSIDTTEGEQAVLASAWRLQRTGNFVAAFDRAQDALRRYPGSRALAYLSVLALASCGSTKAALEAFHAASLGTDAVEDYLALEARLLKDTALSLHGDSSVLSQAAQSYEEVARRTDGTYSLQNAAFLWTLAGDAPRAERLAVSVAKRVSKLNAPAQEDAAYFHWATLAEAALVLNDQELLRRAVVSANPLCRDNAWARSRTFLQLQRLVPLRPDCADLVDAWYRPPVGLLLPADYLPASCEVDPGIGDSDRPALVYCVGGTRSGWHSVASSGLQVHVIYARTPDDIPDPDSIATRRDASGHGEFHTWSSLLLDEDDDYERICAEAALGLSLGQADALHARWMVLVHSGGHWRALRKPDRRIIQEAIAARVRPRAERARYGFLFADAVSYSSLSAADTRRYWTQLLPKAAAEVLRRYAPSLLLRKTWGDAVHAVFRTASAAASAALEMQAATALLARDINPGKALAFRIAVHYGAADQGFDPVEEAPSVYGPQLSFAARIVPVAPPGGVFVTEAFAAQLNLEEAVNVRCSYVGTTSLAKSYGRVRLLSLA